MAEGDRHGLGGNRTSDECAFVVLTDIIGVDGLRAILKDADQSTQRPGVDGTTVSLGSFDATVSVGADTVDFVIGEIGWTLQRPTVDDIVAQSPQNPDAS